MSSEPWPSKAPQDERASFAREVLVEASPEEVWEAIATEQGRERWLAFDEEREVEVEVSQQPERLVWWWAPDAGLQPTRVEFVLRAVARGTVVQVRESVPHFPIEMLARMSGAVLA